MRPFMSSVFLAGSVAAVVIGALLTQGTFAAEPLRMGGTGSSVGLLGKVGAQFTATGGPGVVVISGLGSSGAIRALADGKLDVAVSAAPLKPAQKADGAEQVMVVRTGFVLATSHRDPKGLRVADLTRIFKADKPVWADGAPIRIILRPRSETDTQLLGNLAPGLHEAIEVLRKRTEVPVAATDQDNADMAQRINGSLTVTTLTQLKAEDRRLTLVALDGIEPTFANFESGQYRYAKKLYFVVRAGGAPAAAKFTDFLRSPQGQAAMRDYYVLPSAE